MHADLASAVDLLEIVAEGIVDLGNKIVKHGLPSLAYPSDLVCYALQFLLLLRLLFPETVDLLCPVLKFS